jgi:beta-phosphoglucomutase family hydrolase/RpiB/LacA/LacB family sugar-phosphate isomerase
MRIVIGSDHAGFPVKKGLSTYIRQLGHQLVDVGTHTTDPVDYPDYADALGQTLIHGRAERGVLICGSGVGASVAVNKLPGIRAGLCHDTYSAHQGVEHDNMNVLVLGGRVIGPELARELITVYLGATFTKELSHQRRLQKLYALEERYSVYPGHIQPAITGGRYEAVLFDVDSVITNAASVHATCWKKLFDEYLQKWAAKSDRMVRPFDVTTDYRVYVDGKPRYEGVRDFLKSRRIVLPEGTRKDPPSAETICGLGNRKNDLVHEHLASAGIEAYPGSIAFLKYLRQLGVKTAVVTSSQNCEAILHAAKAHDLFDARVDGDVLLRHGLAGKPAPDCFLKATKMLGVLPDRTVVIEDVVSGVEAGTKGGFGLVIGLARNGNAEELRAHGAHVVVNDLAELLENRTIEAA